jgi:hypothetical protein
VARGFEDSQSQSREVECIAVLHRHEGVFRLCAGAEIDDRAATLAQFLFQTPPIRPATVSMSWTARNSSALEGLGLSRPALVIATSSATRDSSVGASPRASIRRPISWSMSIGLPLGSREGLSVRLGVKSRVLLL